MVQIYRVGSLWQKKGKKWIPSANFSFNNGSRGEARLLPQDGEAGGGAALCNCPTLSHTRLSWLTGSSDVQKNLAERLEEKKYSCPALLPTKQGKKSRKDDWWSAFKAAFKPLTVNIFLTRRCGESSLKIPPLIHVNPESDWEEPGTRIRIFFQ